MKNGEIEFIRPEDCQIRNELGNYQIKEFEYNKSIRSVDLEIVDYKKAGEIVE